jgi:hypothetical protein
MPNFVVSPATSLELYVGDHNRSIFTSLEGLAANSRIRCVRSTFRSSQGWYHHVNRFKLKIRHARLCFRLNVWIAARASAFLALGLFTFFQGRPLKPDCRVTNLPQAS